MSFKLTVLGCGSAIPTLDNNPTAQLLNVNERFFLIDCGEGTQIQLRKYKINLQRINHIFISHLHGDHYFGLIGLISSMHLLGRNKELHIYAHSQLEDIINLQLNASHTELKFPLFFHSIPEMKEEVLFEDDHLSVSNLLLNHSINCSGFLFKQKKSRRKIKKDLVSKLKIPFEKISSIQDGADWIDNNGLIIKNKDITLKNSPPYTYAFCTDTRYNEKLINKIIGVDLLYHETTFKKELTNRANDTGHSTTFDAAEIARKAGVKYLMIGHFSQRYKETSELLYETKDNFKNSILAKTGLTLDFKNLHA